VHGEYLPHKHVECLPQICIDLDVDKLVDIAQRAGAAIMDIYNGDAANWDVDHKADDSPLTRADREANRIICDALQDWTPHIPIISEENKVAPYSTRQVLLILSLASRPVSGSAVRC
jgi:3'(2'), 5'-bisphosphate nucleotidase